MQGPSTPVAQLRQLLDATEQLVMAVRDEQWTAPTPCSEWNVRDLVNHLVAGNRLFAAILRGGEPPPRQATDVLGDQPVAAYHQAADALLDAFSQPGVMERVFSVPLGSVPGSVALHLRLVELLVHGWDLARATGQTVRFPDELVEQELEFSRAKLADIPSTRRPFAPPQPAADDAPAIDRLAACLGRAVSAGGPGG